MSTKLRKSKRGQPPATVPPALSELKLTPEETDVLCALNDFATRGLHLFETEPGQVPLPLGECFPGDVPFWMLAMYVAGAGDVTTSNRISYALKGLCALGLAKERIAFGVPECLFVGSSPGTSIKVECPAGHSFSVSLAAPDRVEIKRPDRPGWNWTVDHSTESGDNRYSITEAGARVVRLIPNEPAKPSCRSVRSGRPRISVKEAHRRERLVEEWNLAKEAGIRQKDFCNGRGVSLTDLSRYVNWRAQRRRRGPGRR